MMSEVKLPPALEAVVAAAPDGDAASAMLLEALTHRTYANERPHLQRKDNQRLELLGDAVLELIVTRALFDRLPSADEGLLSRARAAAVNEGALAEGARTIALGPAILLGRGESASGGRERPRTLADALEAVVAAAYLSAGLDAATRLVETALGSAIASAVTRSASLPARAEVDARVKDPKSVLQERVQRNGAPPPSYEIESAEGPVHDRTFRVRVSAKGAVLGVGEGRSRRDAEMRAAEQAIETMDRMSQPAPPAAEAAEPTDEEPA